MAKKTPREELEAALAGDRRSWWISPKAAFLNGHHRELTSLTIEYFDPPIVAGQPWRVSSAKDAAQWFVSARGAVEAAYDMLESSK